MASPQRDIQPSALVPPYTLERAYPVLRPRFLQALSRLADNGFALSLLDGADLIHDFFLERWERIVDGYDAEKGSIEGYAYKAFIYFARSRIVQLRRVDITLSELNEAITAEASLPSPGLRVELDHDLKRLRQVLDFLPGADRTLLQDFFSLVPPSVRALARQHRLSRYTVQQRLIEALGRVLIWFDKPEGLDEQAWEVSRTILGQHYTLEQTASQHGLTTHQTRQVHARTLRVLARFMKLIN